MMAGAEGFAPGTDTLVRKYNLKDQATALDFASRIFEVTKRHSTFPEIDVVDSEVCIRLTTPEANSLTEKDFERGYLDDFFLPRPLDPSDGRAARGCTRWVGSIAS